MADDGASDTFAIPDWVTVRLTEAYHRVKNWLAGQKLWHERFTDADRARFTQPWPEVWAEAGGTIGMWCHARGGSPDHAIAHVARALGFLDQVTFDAILAAMPSDDAAPGTSRHNRDVLPFWHRSLSEIRYRGEVVRRVPKGATNIRKILDAFQTDGWPDEIYDPFPPDDLSRRRHRAVETLNKGLKGIRFFSMGHGRKIGWKPVDDPPDAATPAA